MNIRNTAIAILAVGAIALGGSPAHAAPDDQVTGSGIIEFDDGGGGGSARVSIAARVDPDADRLTATGQVQIVLDSGESVHGTVTCLVLRDQEAFISGTLDEPIGENGFFLLGIADGGQGPGSDQGGLRFLPGDRDCIRARINAEVSSGNYTVKNR